MQLVERLPFDFAQGETGYVLRVFLQLRACVGMKKGRTRLEASGGVTLDTVGAIAATGVDAISVGGVTHSAPACDLALDWHMAEPRAE